MYQRKSGLSYVGLFFQSLSDMTQQKYEWKAVRGKV